MWGASLKKGDVVMSEQGNASSPSVPLTPPQQAEVSKSLPQAPRCNYMSMPEAPSIVMRYGIMPPPVRQPATIALTPLQQETIRKYTGLSFSHVELVPGSDGRSGETRLLLRPPAQGTQAPPCDRAVMPPAIMPLYGIIPRPVQSPSGGSTGKTVLSNPR